MRSGRRIRRGRSTGAARLFVVALLFAGCHHKSTVYPTCGDFTRNGQETDVDCGGPLCTPCNAGKSCVVDKDCRDRRCAGGLCQMGSCTDGIENGSESDVDCGGPDCPACADGKGCAGLNDCRSRVCSAAVCQPPSCSDGFQNGDESGVDCGGVCPPCDG